MPRSDPFKIGDKIEWIYTSEKPPETPQTWTVTGIVWRNNNPWPLIYTEEKPHTGYFSYRFKKVSDGTKRKRYSEREYVYA